MHTIIVSDQHLTDAEPFDPRRPHWKAYKRREHFADVDFLRLLDYIDRHTGGPVELILNGDTFDFDSITACPDDPEVDLGFLARHRGLGSEEWMSLFKIQLIIRDHPAWFDGLARFLAAGHDVLIVLGNHDVELTWPSVQERLRQALGQPPDGEAEPGRGRLEFVPWFYLSGDDAFISHGQQFDPYCVVKNPVDPLISVHGRPRVRVPFGNLAERYMLNGMGYFNPHATSNYIMTGKEYARFYVRHVMRTQPLLLWTWFWGALATLVVALRESWLPAMRDPLLVEEKYRDIARRSRATPAMVRRLEALTVPPVTGHPWLVLRELWLDRGLLLLLILWLAWQVILTINFVWPISPLWIFLPLALLSFPYALYAAQVQPGTDSHPLLTPATAELLFQITGRPIVSFGHTHVPEHRQVGPVDYVNSGVWSKAFRDPACTERIGTKTFVWLRPGEQEGRREVHLMEWPDNAPAPRPYRRAHDDSRSGTNAAKASSA